MTVTPMEHRRGFRAAHPPVNQVNTADLLGVLRKGYEDFLAMPSHVAFISLIYPVLGLLFASMAFGYDVLPLFFPLVSGFALVGPLAAVGLYELSRRRELGLETRWSDAIEVLRSPAIGSIVAMGAVLVVIFILWLLSAQAIWGFTMGGTRMESYGQLLREVLTTGRGWALIIIGNLVGFAFAALVLIISVIAFPMILDRNVGVGEAMATSRRAVLENPVNMSIWGVMVAAVVLVASVPLFVGLALALPILGHSTWHLYRKVVGR
jgi:uncharacterized membrane protein